MAITLLKAVESEGCSCCRIRSGCCCKTYENILVVQKKDENNEAIKKLIDVLQSDDIRKFIEEKYDGAVVPIK